MANRATTTRLLSEWSPDSAGNGVTSVRILDPSLIQDLIRARRQKGVDRYDEVWEGVLVMPPMPNLDHQDLSGDFYDIFSLVIKAPRKGRVQAGANVSDRRTDWEQSYRVPDIVVVLKNSRAVDCSTHWYGGPDFLLEVASPGDDTDLKIPFYSRIHVRELLIVHRDTRRLRLYRRDGTALLPVAPTRRRGPEWLQSQVVPLAFREKPGKTGSRIQVQRTDGKPGRWLV